MAMVMMTLQCKGEPPTVKAIRERFSLAETEIDASFGVVEVDPEEHLFTFLVEEGAAAKIQPGGDWAVAGPYANPRVEPFGPPRLKGDEES
jgi:hypothetical protein